MCASGKSSSTMIRRFIVPLFRYNLGKSKNPIWLTPIIPAGLQYPALFCIPQGLNSPDWQHQYSALLYESQFFNLTE
jgi:hypothetical protein